MKLGQIDYGPRDTGGWLLWNSDRMPPATLVNRGGYVTVVYVAELSWAESNELIEAVLTCDAETFRGVGPNRMSTMDGAFYITSQNSEDAQAVASALNSVLAFRWRSGERQYTMVTAIQLPEIRGAPECGRGDVVQGAFAKAAPASRQREQDRRKTMDAENIRVL